MRTAWTVYEMATAGSPGRDTNTGHMKLDVCMAEIRSSKRLQQVRELRQLQLEIASPATQALTLAFVRLFGRGLGISRPSLGCQLDAACRIWVCVADVSQRTMANSKYGTMGLRSCGGHAPHHAIPRWAGVILQKS